MGKSGLIGQKMVATFASTGTPSFFLSGVLYLRRKPLASAVVAVLVIATLLWAVWEIGFAFWPMVDRKSVV